MNRQERQELDRHITGNHGEDSVALGLADQTAKVVTTVEVGLDRVAYTLCAALEGGSTYWAERVKVDDYLGYEWAHEAIAAGAAFDVWHSDEKTAVLNSRSIIHDRLNMLAEKYPRHFGDLVGETEDAETGDVFFQLLCFGEVVYG